MIPIKPSESAVSGWIYMLVEETEVLRTNREVDDFQEEPKEIRGQDDDLNQKQPDVQKGEFQEVFYDAPHVVDGVYHCFFKLGGFSFQEQLAFFDGCPDPFDFWQTELFEFVQLGRPQG